jgi:imidazolonepropionase-like amidohydrolase
MTFTTGQVGSGATAPGRRDMTSLFLHNATLIDGTGADPRPGVSVRVEDGRIARLAPASALKSDRDVTVIDATGRFLLPGLTDAHVHFSATEADGRATRPLAAFALRVAAFIEETLDQGFTTVRDAGGLDPAWAQVVAKGLLRGPRILPSGAFLSQTGGHGDWRAPHQDTIEHGIGGLYAGFIICDGADEVRKAARDQLRRGATQIKVMASGGAASPTDPIDATQLTVEELRAAVDEARVRDTYVLAHAYHSKSIANCLEAGVRSIEHGNLLDEKTARAMADEGAFLVPTLITYEVLSERGEQLGMARSSVDKIRYVGASGEDSIRIAMDAGVRIGSGSDLLGEPMREKARELVLQARIMGPMGAIVAATKHNAELFGLSDSIGTIEEGKQADLILVDSDPLANIAVLADASRVQAVVKEGDIVKDLGETTTRVAVPSS